MRLRRRRIGGEPAARRANAEPPMREGHDRRARGGSGRFDVFSLMHNRQATHVLKLCT